MKLTHLGTTPSGKKVFLEKLPNEYPRFSKSDHLYAAVLHGANRTRGGAVADLHRLAADDRGPGAAGRRAHATKKDYYEYVVYPETSHRHAERAVKVPMRRVGSALRPYDLTDAKRVAKQMGSPASIYSVSKGRFVGYVHPSGRYVTFR